jgi:NADP-dependent 3-hydroxy acid dehydrogenase YdfG
MKDKVVIITGASAGIGLAVAELAVARGARVVLAARRQAELDAAAARLGDRAIAVVADVTRRADNELLRD